jgi:hypothetical protein
MQSSPDHLDRADLAVLALLVVLAIFVGNVLVHAPSCVGEYKDDGIYLATGKSLAQGHGYHEPHLPGSPGQTKYPILYPLLLAGLWRLFPDLPAMVAPLQITNTLLWAAGSWAAYLAMRRAWRLPWWLPACGVSLAFVHTGTLGLLQTAMSEPLYLLCSMVSLLSLALDAMPKPRAAERGHALTSSSQAEHARNRLFLAGWVPAVLAGAAYLTRIIGVAAMVAVLSELIARRRWRQVVLATLIMAATVLGWRMWCMHASHANSQIPAVAALSYELDYSPWVPPSIAAAARVATFNASAMLAEFTDLLLPTQIDATTAVLQGRAPGLPLLYCMFALVTGLILAGAAAAWNRAALPLHVYLLVYLGLVLVWPFPPMRFLLPVAPLLATCFLAGVYAVIGRLARLAAWLTATSEESALSAEPARISQNGAPAASSRLQIVAVLLLAGVLFYPSVRLISVQPGREQFQASADTREALLKLLEARTPPDAVICCEFPALVYLRTGRTAVPFLPWTDPLPFIYPADRELSTCGRAETRGAVQSVINHVKAELVDYLRATGATHVVPPEESTSQGVGFATLRLSRPGYFRLIDRVDRLSVYRVEAPARK